ncbi:unnamed protein product, partial [marine sediment metagenome]
MGQDLGETVGKAIPNEFSKLAGAAKWIEKIPIVGQVLGIALRAVSSVDNAATAYGDDAGLINSAQAGIQGASGQSADPGRFGSGPTGGQGGIFNNIGSGLNLLNSGTGGGGGNSGGGIFGNLLGGSGGGASSFEGGSGFGGSSGFGFDSGGNQITPGVGATGGSSGGDISSILGNAGQSGGVGAGEGMPGKFNFGNFLSDDELIRQNAINAGIKNGDTNSTEGLQTIAKLAQMGGDILSNISKRDDTAQKNLKSIFPNLPKDREITKIDLISQQLLSGNPLFPTTAAPNRVGGANRRPFGGKI